ncbi:MAG TPA: hypothetical protein VGN18_04100 [Jatrophihabitans sp.]|jgi:glutathione synthase/RimK-type ligase-like ATP-grasp enzyme|uniref:ATP-grasp domain-containing protein n=1 Tax=Jatrophihabitans sp. TaxID=1932789 RepID=UPI002DFD69CF|nr:hypothetical protein [Jatrophihabitans sp.]
MATVLLATCAELPEADEDAGVLEAALARLGADARWAVWTDPAVDWSAGLVVLRSTWDYTVDVDRFLGWVEGLDRVANEPKVIAWNTDKLYLRDLADAGVPTVPTAFAAPGDPVPLPQTGQFVLKPSVGAGSRGAGRFEASRSDDARAHAASLHAAGRTILIQPYLDAVDAAGETALIYLDGAFSHAIRKGAMLPETVAHAVDADVLYVEEEISARTPSAAELEVGAAALAAIRDRFGADLLYTRVDLLPSPDGPVVVELELTEPSLFLQYGADAADSFAAAIVARA